MKRKRSDELDTVVCRHCGKGYKAITVSHLHFKHDYQGEHPILDYKRRFKRRWAHSQETLDKLRETGRRKSREAWADYTEEKILAAFQKAAERRRAGHRYRLSNKLRAAAHRTFGSVRAAALRAGLSYTELSGRTDWTPEIIISQIQDLARRRHRGGGPPCDENLRLACVRHFGSLQAAVTAAGLDFDRFAGSLFWTPDEVLQVLRLRASRQRGSRGPMGAGLMTAARRHFGSLPAAAHAAGVDLRASQGVRLWSREVIIAEIRELAARRRIEAVRADRNLCDSAIRHFGSWPAAIQAAGFDPVEFRRLRFVREVRQRREQA